LFFASTIPIYRDYVQNKAVGTKKVFDASRFDFEHRLKSLLKQRTSLCVAL